MPGRTRRVRILALALCLVTIFFLYQRNSDQVDSYTGYFTQSAVGGGSVLRTGEQEPIVRPIQQAPAKDTEPAFFAQTTKPEKAFVPEPTTTTTKALYLETTTTTPLAVKPTTTKAVLGGQLDEDKLPVEIGVELVEQDPTNYAVSTSSAIHWTKLPEQFPISSTIQLPSSKPSSIPLIQKQGNVGVDKERLAAVKEATKWAWKGFRENGWGYDEVRPITGGGQNSFNGWGATLVDSLDTLWIMGMVEEFEEAVNKTAEIDFTTSSRNDIPLFEVTIRYLGGMIAAYDISGRNKKYQVLLDKAVELAEILYSAFDTPNRMPETYYKWKPTYAKNAHLASTRAVMAEIGTLSLEFTRLAQLTGEPKYYDAIARITDAFEEWQNRTRVPGMWPTLMDASGCKTHVQKKTPTTTSNQQKPVAGDSKPQPIAGSDKSTSGNKATTSQKAAGDKSTDVKSSPGAQYKGPAKENVKPADLSETPDTGSYSVKETNDKMGTVANPMAANIHHADSSSNLRHSMDEIEHPLNKDNGDLSEKISNLGTPSTPGVPGNPAQGGITNANPPTNDKNAKGPLPPKAEAANVRTDPKAVPYGEKEHEPLPPKGVGESPIHKRQLDQVEQPRAAAPPSNAKVVSEPRQVVKQLNSLSDDGDAEEPDCIPQGFESVSKNSPESYTLGGMSDSTYEYLPKMHLLLGGRTEQYKTMYLDSMKTVISKLLYRPMTPDEADILISGELKSTVNYTTGESQELLVPKGEHLTCFVGGMFGMGGKIFNLPEHVEFGKKLTDGCVWTYNATKSGIMPESFTMKACDSMTSCRWNKTAYYEALDPLFEFREEQREDFMETYNITDLVAYEKELAATKAAEEAAASSSSAAAAAATAAVLFGEENSITPGIANAPGIAPNADLKGLTKRQLIDSTLNEAPPGPRPADPNLTPPTTTTKTTVEPPTVPEGPVSGHANEIPGYGSAYYDDDYVAPPAWTPAPPPTHQHYVERKIHDERLPAGFTYLNGRAYILRPEAIESVFYMYRITGDQYWRDMGWKMFKSIEQATHAPFGHASIDDVTKGEPEKHDKMESFWIAETLKYFYLLFDEPGKWSLDDWVLNTEAHFFRRPENPGALAAV